MITRRESGRPSEGPLAESLVHARSEVARLEAYEAELTALRDEARQQREMQEPGDGTAAIEVDIAQLEARAADIRQSLTAARRTVSDLLEARRAAIRHWVARVPIGSLEGAARAAEEWRAIQQQAVAAATARLQAVDPEIVEQENAVAAARERVRAAWDAVEQEAAEEETAAQIALAEEDLELDRLEHLLRESESIVEPIRRAVDREALLLEAADIELVALRARRQEQELYADHLDIEADDPDEEI
jgi:hypothetical protein